jgi:mono/diheme cytochrome c family protein
MPERRNRPWRPAVAVLTALVLLGWWGGRAGAQDEESIARGRTTFRVYCQSCHGADARGNGRIAELMKVRPADLTQLARENDGTFPADKLARIIDGRADVAAHGDREMPVWGQSFLETAGNEADVKTRIQQLVDFLQTIQEKGAAKKK